MIKIKLVRTIKGKDYIKEMKKEHGSIKELKKLFDEGKGDMKLELDLENWEYLAEHPEEKLDQEVIIYDETPSFTMTDLKILDLIKNEKPESITELATMMDKDSGNIAKQVNKLKEKGFIDLEEGKVNNIKTPVFNYDKIEIAI
jgi:hypothetical protein